LYDDEEMLGLLLEILTKVRVGQENALESWTSIINQLALIGEQNGSRSWSPAVMRADLDRLRISIDMWFKHPRILKKFPLFEAALLRLYYTGEVDDKRRASIYERDFERVQPGSDAPITILERYLLVAIREAIGSQSGSVGLSRAAPSAAPSAAAKPPQRRNAYESDTDEPSDVESDEPVPVVIRPAASAVPVSRPAAQVSRSAASAVPVSRSAVPVSRSAVPVSRSAVPVSRSAVQQRNVAVQSVMAPSWDCEACTFLNIDNSKHCGICGSNKPNQ